MNIPPREWEPDELCQRYWAHSGVPPRHVEALVRLANPAEGDKRAEKWDKALDAVVGALTGDGIVALLGNRGAGKTQIAVKVIHDYCLLLGIPSMYRRLGDVYTAIRDTYDNRKTSEGAVMDRLVRCGLLVLDECHERAASPFEGRTLTRLIDSRYMAKKPTLLISNETPEAFVESMGPSISDRLREDGKIIVAQWESFRKPLGSVVQRIE